MNILVISQYYTPDITAAAFRISETVNHLDLLDHDIQVVTAFPQKSEVPEDKRLSNGSIHRLKVPDTDNKGFWGYIYLYLSFMFKSLFKGLQVGRKQQPDVVWASSPPIFVGVSGWILAKTLGAGFALDIRDVWPDSAVAAGQISNDGPAYGLGRLLEKFLYRNADVISCVARPMKDYIQQYTDRPVEVIYNGVDTSDTGRRPETKENILDYWATDKQSRKLLYAGNLGHVQQLDLLVNTFAEITADKVRDQWEIFFLGGGAQKENLMQLAGERELTEQVHFLDPVPKEEVFDYLQSTDVLFIHIMDSDVLRLTIPSKVFDYMLADRPLLAGIAGEGRQIINSVEGNVTFTPGNENSLKKAFVEMNARLSGSETLNNASVVRENFNRKKQSEKLNQMFNECFS